MHLTRDHFSRGSTHHGIPELHRSSLISLPSFLWDGSKHKRFPRAFQKWPFESLIHPHFRVKPKGRHLEKNEKKWKTCLRRNFLKIYNLKVKFNVVNKGETQSEVQEKVQEENQEWNQEWNIRWTFGWRLPRTKIGFKMQKVKKKNHSKRAKGQCQKWSGCTPSMSFKFLIGDEVPCEWENVVSHLVASFAWFVECRRSDRYCPLEQTFGRFWNVGRKFIFGEKHVIGGEKQWTNVERALLRSTLKMKGLV